MAEASTTEATTTAVSSGDATPAAAAADGAKDTKSAAAVVTPDGDKKDGAAAAAAGSATPTATTTADGEGDATDAEIEAMKKRVKEMEDEAKKIEDMQNNVEKSLKPKPAAPAAPSGPDVDARSVYVGNVDYSTTPEELQEFFASCGIVNRITILCDKFTGHPKGYAYVEFKDTDSIANAMLLNDSEFKGRPLKVTPKRTNVPGLAEYRGGGGGRGGRGGRGAPRTPRGGRGGGGFRSPGGGRGGGGAYGGYQSYAPAPRFRHRRFTSPYSR